jgi:hypothetical protein
LSKPLFMIFSSSVIINTTKTIQPRATRSHHNVGFQLLALKLGHIRPAHNRLYQIRRLERGGLSALLLVQDRRTRLPRGPQCDTYSSESAFEAGAPKC